MIVWGGDSAASLTDTGGVYDSGAEDRDGDGLCDNIDNCPTMTNPTQLDTDLDTLGDACDPDDDNDGILDTADCERLSSNNCQDQNPCTTDSCGPGLVCQNVPGPLPGEVSGFAASSATSFAWNDLGPGTTYDVLRGAIGEFPVGSGGSETYHQSTAAPMTSDATPPPAGSGVYYLVRGENVCGNGSYGAATGGAPRLSGACP